MRTRNLKLVVRVTNQGSILWSVREVPNLLVQGKLPGGDEHSSVVGHVEAGKRLEHCLKKTSTAQEADKPRKVPAATDTCKTNVALEEADYCVWLSKVKTMID